MTARNRTRAFLVGAAVTALIAPLAIVAALASPASAAPGKPHEVYIYKVEKHVDMSGEYPDQYMHEHLSCNSGDIALDGMWRVDHVDQPVDPPEPGFYGDERDVVFTASYGDPGDRAYWHFRAHNYADGDAQIKLFLTCIRGSVEQAYNHYHNVVISNAYVDHYDNLGVDTFPTIGNQAAHTHVCDPGEVAVAPGFNFNQNGAGDDDHRARLVKSWPSDNTYRGWQWAFIVSDPGVDLDLYLRCLRVKTTGPSQGSNHAHNLQWAFRPGGFSGDHQNFTVFKSQERRINCDDGFDGSKFQDYKAAVAGFILPDPWHIWFLGMDPRPKQRAYKFWYESGATDVYLGALCIRARTSKQVAP